MHTAEKFLCQSIFIILAFFKNFPPIASQSLPWSSFITFVLPACSILHTSANELLPILDNSLNEELSIIGRSIPSIGDFGILKKSAMIQRYK